MYVKDYMQAIVVTVSPNELLSTARHLMDQLFIRHLPVVVEGNQLIGVVTDRDIRQADVSNCPDLTVEERYEGFYGMRVRHVMTRPPHTVTHETTLIEAAGTMLEQKFDCLPVVDEVGILIGLIALSDFARIYIEEHDSAMV
jgi:acetoin utilization protein AcuB